MDDNQSSRYTQTKTSDLAIISLVAGLLGWIIPILGAIVAIYTGHKAKGEIRDSEGALTGNGMATVGLVLGYVQIVLIVIPICVIVVLALLGPGIENIFTDIIKNI